MLTTENRPTPNTFSLATSLMPRVWIGAGAVFGLLGVIAGAAGTHALRGTLDADALATFETAVRFQIYHAIALLAVGVIAELWQAKTLNWAGGLFVAGILLFSGSLYGLATLDLKVLGALAPVGGLSLMMGWGFLLIAAIRRKSTGQTRRTA